MNHKRGFTLIEIMVVVAIIALLAVLTVPSLRAMRSANARAQTFNTINAALMAARSYAIMNGVRTAARFQPNGKIFLVYRADGNAQSNVCSWNGTVQPLTNATGGDLVYLPVIDQEPLQIPQGYAVADARPVNQRRPFFEPFYICYNPDGTLAGSETVRVALAEVYPLAVRPFSINFSGLNPSTGNGPNDFAWWHDDGSKPIFAYDSGSKTSWDQWLDYSEKKTDNVRDPADRALARFYNVAINAAGLENVLNETRDGEDPDYGPDHYGGAYIDNFPAPGYPAGVPVNLRHWSEPTTQLAIFKTPENWDQMKLFSATPTEKTKQLFVDDETNGILAENGGVQTKEGEFDRIFLNAYTGRVIRPVEE